MVDRVAPAHRWVFPVVVMLLVLGHACELPAYAGLVGSFQAAEESHHSGDGHHPGAQELSCDAVSATSSPESPQVNAALGVSLVRQVDDPVPARMVVRSVEGPAKFRVRPPLFLLHASLLI
jgi:hypothetical protein